MPVVSNQIRNDYLQNTIQKHCRKTFIVNVVLEFDCTLYSTCVNQPNQYSDIPSAANITIGAVSRVWYVVTHGRLEKTVPSSNLTGQKYIRATDMRPCISGETGKFLFLRFPKFGCRTTSTYVYCLSVSEFLFLRPNYEGIQLVRFPLSTSLKLSYKSLQH